MQMMLSYYYPYLQCVGTKRKCVEYRSFPINFFYLNFPFLFLKSQPLKNKKWKVDDNDEEVITSCVIYFRGH